MQSLDTLTEKNLRVAGFHKVIRQSKKYGVNCDEKYKGWFVEEIKVTLIQNFCVYFSIASVLIMEFVI